MPFVHYDPEQWKRTATRVLNIGPPNSRKTSALHTWPTPLKSLVYPGEKGTSSFIQEPGVRDAYVWEVESDAECPKLKDEKHGDMCRACWGVGRVFRTTSPAETFRQIVQETKKVISGAYGTTVTFAGEGLHKLYDIIYAKNLESLDAYGTERKGDKHDIEDVRGRAYGLAHKEFINYLTMVNQSKVPYVVFTCWSAREKDDKNDQRRDAPSHIWPDLPGEAAKWILGEFAVTLYSRVGLPQPNGEAKAEWILRPQGEIHGVGVKMPPHIAKKIPPVLPQDWARLEPLLLGQV